MKKTFLISAALLPSDLRARFTEMLPVAARRSIVTWELTQAASADVVLRDRQGPDHERNGDSVPIYVTDTPLSGGDANLLRMEQAFRVNTLMDMLDLAAVRLMNRREQSARVAVALPTRADTLYRLKHWVFLGASRGGANYMRVLATMSREGVSRQWMVSTGGLSEAQADTLLAELQLRGALVSQAPQATAPAARSTPASRGFVTRLKRWISGSRPQTLASGT